MGLLRLPRMPELKKGSAANALEAFSASGVDPDSVKFKDRTREKQRQKVGRLCVRACTSVALLTRGECVRGGGGCLAVWPPGGWEGQGRGAGLGKAGGISRSVFPEGCLGIWAARRRCRQHGLKILRQRRKQGQRHICVQQEPDQVGPLLRSSLGQML